MSDSMKPHRRQPTRLPRPWDSPGKNTEVSYHFLLQCMKVKSESEVAQSCLTLRDPMDCSPPSSCSVQSLSRVRLFRPRELEHARPPCPSPTPGVYSNSCPSSQWCHPAISPSAVPFSSCPQSSQHQGLFQWVNSSHEVAKVLEFKLQHQSF